MLVQCRFRGDHKTNRSRPHGPSQCPPPVGEHGDHRRRKRLRKRNSKKAAKFMAGTVRGVSVAGTGKPSASSDKKAGVKKEASR